MFQGVKYRPEQWAGHMEGLVAGIVSSKRPKSTSHVLVNYRCACRLDVMPGIVRKFRSNGDEATAQLLEDVVYRVRSNLDTSQKPPWSSQGLWRRDAEGFRI